MGVGAGSAVAQAPGIIAGTAPSEMTGAAAVEGLKQQWKNGLITTPLIGVVGNIPNAIERGMQGENVKKMQGEMDKFWAEDQKHADQAALEGKVGLSVLAVLAGGSAAVILSGGAAIPVLVLSGGAVAGAAAQLGVTYKAAKINGEDKEDLQSLWCHLERKCGEELPEVYPLVTKDLKYYTKRGWRKMRNKLSKFSCDEYLRETGCDWTCAYPCQMDKPSRAQCGEQRMCEAANPHEWSDKKMGWRDEGYECCCMQKGYKQAKQPDELIDCEED
eukprot:TRINITY_DN7632_c0_g1_i5.p1 TRINITY_DN7632_c0_g1~~TRINITY_DN7632_c0_g1_i5.p1  ORF type:complete len:274 (+),score=76.15 TRINITY_DN7632_c0_g1_i5:524-1345(+)